MRSPNRDLRNFSHQDVSGFRLLKGEIVAVRKRFRPTQRDFRVLCRSPTLMGLSRFCSTSRPERDPPSRFYVGLNTRLDTRISTDPETMSADDFFHVITSVEKIVALHCFGSSRQRTNSRPAVNFLFDTEASRMESLHVALVMCPI